MTPGSHQMNRPVDTKVGDRPLLARGPHDRDTDHDMRNPTDFLVLNKLAKGIFAVPGISRLQAITRPEGSL